MRLVGLFGPQDVAETVGEPGLVVQVGSLELEGLTTLLEMENSESRLATV